MAAGVAACFGWMVWMVAGVGGHSYSSVNFGSRKKQSFPLLSHIGWPYVLNASSYVVNAS